MKNRHKSPLTVYNLPFVLKGFTLSEVLITLGIIGIVATLTIPVLNKFFTEVNINSSVKKFQSTLSQALAKYALDNDCVGNLANCGLFNNGASENEAGHLAAWTALKPYFKIFKDCGTGINKGCFATNVNYIWLNKTNASYDYLGDLDGMIQAKGILADGMSIWINDYADNCITDRTNSSGPSPLSNVCAQVIIDINGSKKPNQVGKDTFFWYIAKNGSAYAMGSLNDLYQGCNPAGSTSATPLDGRGAACTAEYLNK